MAITYGSIAGAEPSTITFNVETVVIDHNSTLVHREIMVIGDPQTSNAIAVVKAAPPVSTEFGQVVRIASGPSSAADLLMRPVFSSTNTDNPVRAVLSSTAIDNPVRPVFSSTNTDNPVRAFLSSTAADNPVVISGNSTAFQGGSWTVRANLSSTSADNPMRANLSSTAADNPVLVSGNSTVFQGGAPWTFSETMQSSVAPSSGSSGVIVRQVIDNILTTASTNALAGSTALAIQSSGAAIRSYVTAYSITSTVTAATKIAFYSGSTMIWPVVIQAVSSAMAGANLATGGAAYLFRTKAAGPLTLNCKGSTIAGFQVAVSYFRAV